MSPQERPWPANYRVCCYLARLISANSRSVGHETKGKSAISNEGSARPTSGANDTIDDIADALLDDSIGHSADMLGQDESPMAHSDARSISSQLLLDSLNKPLPALPVDSRTGKHNTSPCKNLERKTTRAKLARAASRLATNFGEALAAVYDTPSAPNRTNSNHLSPARRVPPQSQGLHTSEDRLASVDKRRMGIVFDDSQSTKSSRLQRGKDVFGRAKRAFADHLSSSNERNGTKRAGIVRLNSSPDIIGGLVGGVDDDPERGRVTRRIAEGNNLSNPKIQLLTGDGKVICKPLPVHESMRSRKDYSSSSDDIFMSKQDSFDELASSTFPSLDVDFDSVKSRRFSAIEPLIAKPQPDAVFAGPSQATKATPASKYTEYNSGLAQHPDVMIFSSPPIGFSTPWFRYDTSGIQNSKRRKDTMTSTAPSLPEFDWEVKSNDEDPESPHPTKRRPIVKESLKRKSGSTDLPLQSAPSAKKIKKFVPNAVEDVVLNNGMAHLDTSTDRALKPKDKNRRLSQAQPSEDKGKGLKIFDIGRKKTSTSTSRAVETLTKPRTGRAGQRASISGPVLLTPAHRRRVSTPVLGFGYGQDDTMSMDELQMP